jgi:UMF1 family MFS transporter
MTTLVHDLSSSSQSSMPQTPVVTSRAPAKERWSWALYDFANTIFSMNIATLYFAVWLVADLKASNTMVALGNGVASALVILSIPIFGAISDATQRRKPWVIGFTLLTVAATFGIGVIGQEMVPLVGDSIQTPASITNYQIGGAALAAIILAFIIANYAYQGALPFYNAMMTDLAPPHERGNLSGIGVALGYLGSIAGVMLVTPFFNGELPVLGAISDSVMNALRTLVPFTEHGGRVSTFAPTALLYLLFSLPLFFFCRDHFPIRRKDPIPWKQAFRDIKNTIRDTKQYPGTMRFLFASFVYQDAMGTIISYMALYAVVAMGFKEGSETTLFVVLTIPAVVGSWLWGRLTDRIGPKNTLLMITVFWIISLGAMILVKSQTMFWAIGAFIGFIYGGLNVAERPMLLQLVPDQEAGRFFSLMVLSARAAAIVGPFIWGFAVDGLTPVVGVDIAYRAAVGTVAVTMIIAFFVLRGVPGRRTAS